MSFRDAKIYLNRRIVRNCRSKYPVTYGYKYVMEESGDCT